MPDLKAQLVETIENNEFMDFAKKNNINYFIYGSAEGEAWVKFNLGTSKDTEIFFACLNDWLMKRTENKLRMIVVENEEPQEGEEPKE